MFLKRSPKLYGYVLFTFKEKIVKYAYMLEHEFPFAFESLTVDLKFCENGEVLFYESHVEM